ncbi:crotonyl-CoA carboxylase/reductase [soil metagenome]
MSEDKLSGERGKSPEIYALQEYGELGVVPEKMHAWAIRKERFGEPLQALEQCIVPVPEDDENRVLVRVIAVGVNYNTVWAGLGEPISVFRLHDEEFHVPGSDASGIVWRVGANVHNCKVGDEVIVTCLQQSLDHGNGNLDNPNFCSFDPMSSQEHAIMGYETPDGSFAQFVAVQAQQILPKPKHLSWEDAASYILTYFTAYRMLITQGHVKAGELALIWGGAGGLGTYAIQICREMGVDAIAVVSTEEKGEFCKKLGAIGYINRKEFTGYEVHDMAVDQTEASSNQLRRNKAMKAIGKRIWEICGEKRSPDIVFEHSGQETFATSVFLAARFGRIVICGATTGYDLAFDVRHLWMHQKRIIGSHYANFLDCRQANTLITKRKIEVINSRTYAYQQLAQAHQDLFDNHIVGNASVLVLAGDVRGLKTREEIEARFQKRS